MAYFKQHASIYIKLY